MQLNTTKVNPVYAQISAKQIGGSELGRFMVTAFKIQLSVNNLPSASVVLSSGIPVSLVGDKYNVSQQLNALYDKILKSDVPLFISLKEMSSGSSPSKKPPSQLFLSLNSTPDDAKPTQSASDDQDSLIFSGYIINGQSDVILRQRQSQTALQLSCKHHAVVLQTDPFNDAVFIPLTSQQITEIQSPNVATQSGDWYQKLATQQLRKYQAPNSAIPFKNLKQLRSNLGLSTQQKNLTVLQNINANMIALQVGSVSGVILSKIRDTKSSWDSVKSMFFNLQKYVQSNYYLNPPQGYRQVTISSYYKKVEQQMRAAASSGADIWSMFLSLVTGQMRLMRIVPTPIYKLLPKYINKLTLQPQTRWGGESARTFNCNTISSIIYAATPGIVFTQPDIIRVQFSGVTNKNDQTQNTKGPMADSQYKFQAAGVYVVDPKKAQLKLGNAALLRHKTFMAPSWASIALADGTYKNQQQGQQQPQKLSRFSKQHKKFMDKFAEACFTATYRNIQAMTLRGPFSFQLYRDKNSPWYQIDEYIGKKITVQMGADANLVHKGKKYIGNMDALILAYTSDAQQGKSSFIATINLSSVHQADTDSNIGNQLYKQKAPQQPGSTDALEAAADAVSQAIEEGTR